MNRRKIILAAAALALVGGGAALAADGDVYVPQLGISVPADKAPAVQHSLPSSSAPESSERAPVPTGPPDRIPAQLLPADVPIPVGPDVIDVANAWLVSDGATLVAVYAGAAGDDAANGRFFIVRQNLVRGIQTVDAVDVRGAGRVELVDPPAGAAAETSAQRGDLAFRGPSGARGVLHLAHDTVG